MDCDPNDLAQLAKCFDCLPPIVLQQIQAYLLCQIVIGGGLTPGSSGLSGFGSPEGVVLANAGATYVDKTDGSFYWKSTDGTNTGWKP